MTKGQSEEKSISYTLGFQGSAEIKSFKPSLSAAYSRSYTTTVSASQTCPAWTTMNWRPYSVYWKDYYTGYAEMELIEMVFPVVIKSTYYETLEGTNNRMLTETTEVWSRKNSNKNVNLATPLPPSSQPVL